MIWVAVAAAASASAAAHQRLVVPRLPPPALGAGETAPDYRALAGARDVAGAALLAALAGALVLPGMPGARLLLWVAYLGAGAALVWVDLLSTWLPRRLNHLCLAQVALGLAALAIVDWKAALAGLAGSAAALGLFHLVWRLGTGFGYGDVRLAAIVGAVAGTSGPQAWTAAMLAGTVVGALWAVAHTVTLRRRGAPAHFPYGPALWLGPVLATWVSGW